MKRTLFWILLILILAFNLIGCGTDLSQEEEVYIVATDPNFVPFEFLNRETGELEGFDIDLMRAIAKEAGFTVKFEAIDWDGFITSIESGRYDMGMNGLTITDERRKKVDFSNPYYEAGLIIAVRSDNRDIKSEKDLAGKKVGTRANTTSETYLRTNHPNAIIVPYPGSMELYMDLRLGRIDAVLYDVPNIKYYIATEAKDKLKTVGEVLQGESYGVVFPKGSKLVERINKALVVLMENGTYAEIYEKWFGK